MDAYVSYYLYTYLCIGHSNGNCASQDWMRTWTVGWNKGGFTLHNRKVCRKYFPVSFLNIHPSSDQNFLSFVYLAPPLGGNGCFYNNYFFVSIGCLYRERRECKSKQRWEREKEAHFLSIYWKHYMVAKQQYPTLKVVCKLLNLLWNKRLKSLTKWR